MSHVMPFRPHCHSTPSAHFMSCAESHCCQDAAWFGCFRRPLRPAIAQCLPMSHQSVNGTCVDTDQWLCPQTWLQPPPPPAPPSPPPPSPSPQLPPMPPEAEPGHRCHADPSEHYATCLESRCCKDSRRYGCFRKRNKVWAACMPLAHQTPAGQIRCVSNDEWLCPSDWLAEPPPPPLPAPPPPPFFARCAYNTRPAGHYESCLDSHCCMDNRAYGCFRKAGKHFAQCLPLAHMLQPDGSCVDGDWLCPASWLAPPPPPAAPSPPPYIAGCVGNAPAANYASCLDTHCCADPSFGCFRRTDKHWAECLPYAHMGVDASSGACVGTAQWMCPHMWLTPSPPTAPPPPPPPPAPSPSPRAPTAAKLQLVESKQAVFTLSMMLGVGMLVLALVTAALAHVLCFRRKVAPHLTSVVDEDAGEVQMNGKGMKDDILE